MSCKKAAPSARDRAIASAMAGTSASAPSGRSIDANPYDDAALPPPGDAEAVHATLSHPGFEELLAGARPLLDQRFQGIPASSIELQIAGLPEGQRAVLASAPQPGPRPLLLLLDDQRRMRWSKERPTGGLDAAVEHLAITSSEKGDVLLCFCDPSSGVVAARKWDNEGGLIIDFRLLDMETCGPVSALRWPGQGWLVVVARGPGTRAQLLTEAGKMPWGRDGRMLRETGDAPGPRPIGLDDESSFVVLGASRGEPGHGLRRQAMRYDERGNPSWRTPLEIGESPLTDTASRRPRLDRVRPGVLRTMLQRTGPGGRMVDEELEITSDGRVVLR